MDTDMHTGEERHNRAPAIGGRTGLTVNTFLQDARCDAYDAYGLTSEGASVSYRRHARPATAEQQEKVLQSERYALGRHLVHARELGRKMAEAASANDQMELACHGIALLEALECLWKLRHVREEPWASVLNFLQSALTRKEFELYSHDQCAGVARLVEEHLAGGVVSEKDVTRVVKRLKDLDLDPWRAISEQKEAGNADGNGSIP